MVQKTSNIEWRHPVVVLRYTNTSCSQVPCTELPPRGACVELDCELTPALLSPNRRWFVNKIKESTASYNREIGYIFCS